MKFEALDHGVIIGYISILGHAKLISCSTEHQGNEVGSVGRKENK